MLRARSRARRVESSRSSRQFEASRAFTAVSMSRWLPTTPRTIPANQASSASARGSPSMSASNRWLANSVMTVSTPSPASSIW
jgi:hypothetical protein